jgi:hypothetical protein
MRIHGRHQSAPSRAGASDRPRAHVDDRPPRYGSRPTRRTSSGCCPLTSGRVLARDRVFATVARHRPASPLRTSCLGTRPPDRHRQPRSGFVWHACGGAPALAFLSLVHDAAGFARLQTRRSVGVASGETQLPLSRSSCPSACRGAAGLPAYTPVHGRATPTSPARPVRRAAAADSDPRSATAAGALRPVRRPARPATRCTGRA